MTATVADAPLSTTEHNERVRVLTAKKNHKCWAYLEGTPAPGDSVRYPDGGPRCSRIILAGEQYVESTIYPGHESGYAEDGPVRTRHCMPCANRWTNLFKALRRLGIETTRDRALREWNEQRPIGTQVEFWPGVRGEAGTGTRGVTTSAAWMLGEHTPVVIVDQYPGGIDLTHVRVVTD